MKKGTCCDWRKCNEPEYVIILTEIKYDAGKLIREIVKLKSENAFTDEFIVRKKNASEAMTKIKIEKIRK